MSYILDALNKSEQERQQREHGVTLQPLTGLPHGEETRRRWLPWISVGIVVAALVVFVTVYLLMRGGQISAPSPQPVADGAVTAASSRAPAAVTSASPRNDSVALSQQTASSAAVPKPTTNTAARVPSTDVASSGAGNESVKSLYQRKGMTAEQARAEQQFAAMPAAISAAIPAAPAASTEAVKTFASDEPATVRTPEVDKPTPATAAPRANLEALQSALKKEREAELAARVQSEIEALQARDAADEERVTTKTAAPAAVAEPPVPLATDLPPAVQQRIPGIEFGAHVYAGRTGAGFVILNEKKRYAGDTVAPGLTVERITEDGVILDMGGTRFKLESMHSWFK